MRENRLEILEVVGKTKNGAVLVRAKCSCGKEITTRRYSILAGDCRSCGCLRTGSKDPTRYGYRNLFSRYRYGAKKRSVAFSLSMDEFLGLVLSDCYYCGLPPSQRSDKYYGVSSNGVDRVDNDLGYVKDNCVPCCSVCNTMKMTLPKDTFISHCVMVASRFQGIGIWSKAIDQED